MKCTFLLVSIMIFLISGFIILSSTDSASYIDQTTLRFKSEYQTFGFAWNIKITDSDFTAWALRVKEPGPEKWFFTGSQALIGINYGCGLPPPFMPLAGMISLIEEHDPETANTLFKQLVNPHTKVDELFMDEVEQAFQRIQSN